MGTFFSLCAATLFAQITEQIPEQNVNMVAGTGWPHGDPFLQRQNEPSVAVSTRNPLHLLAGANDYRSVDIPFDTPASPDNEERGDAWVGVFKSRNGGQTWWSDLLPGYPQDSASTSPIHGFQAAADPVVRAGANGMFYFSGIVLNRDTNPLGAVFVSRFIDNNNTENGDPIALIDTNVIDKGTAGAFIDKPWIAVAPGTGQCTVSGQTFPAQNVYLVYTIFVGSGNNLRTKLMFARSTDCGATWGQPTKLSEEQAINQGATIAVAPNGTVYVVWRRFKNTNQTNAILIAKSTDQGKTFGKSSVIANINPFEQGMTYYSIRTNAYPAAATDESNNLYVVWADRGFEPDGDGRIVMMRSPDGANWTGATVVDGGLWRGSQFMPAITAVGGKVVVAYYDLRDDSELRYYIPVPHSGGVYDEHEQPVGDLGDVPAHPELVFTQYLMDLAHHRRHTLDLRAAQASTSVMPTAFDGFTRVSRYTFGSRPPQNPTTLCELGPGCIEQLQYNPPNLPMFRLGTAPFIGDYIDIAGYGSGTERVLHAVWTDNRDVRPPADGNWANYTPPHLVPVKSTFGSGNQPDCMAGQTGMRNQNIYTARITNGLFASSPGNSKQLIDKNGQPITRAFVVYVQNATKVAKTFRLTANPPSVANPPSPGWASFDQFTIVPQIYVSIPARSSVTRSVYVNSSVAHASASVTIEEYNGGVVPNGLTATVVINPDVSNPDVSNPDASNPDVSNPDVSNPDVSNPDVSNVEVHNPDVSNPDVSNPDVSNLDVSNPDVSNPDVSNPDVSNPDVSNPDVSNPDVSNPDVSNPDVSNPDVSNASVTDTTWTTHNKGNTTSGYIVKLATNNPPTFCTASVTTNCVHTQLIVNRIYQTPVARGCTLGVENKRQIIANIIDPQFTTLGQLTTPDPDDATVWLAPGDAARITLRVYGIGGAKFDPVTAVIPAVISEAANTNAAMTFIATPTPDAVVGQQYTKAFGVIGGVVPYTWTATGVPNFAIDNNGVLTGTFTAAGDYSFTVNVTDSAAHTLSTIIVVHVYDPLVITTTSLPTALTGVPYTATLNATGGKTPYAWHLDKGSLPTGLSLDPTTGTISGTATATASSFLLFGVTDSAQPKHTAQKDLGFTVTIAFTANVNLVYNNGPLTPTTPPDMWARRTDVQSTDVQGNDLDPAQIVWNGSTVIVTGLVDGQYVLEVASRESAASRYLPGGFFGQVFFTVADQNVTTSLFEYRLIHVTSPLDNGSIITSGKPCQPTSVAMPSTLTWDPIELPNATYTYTVTKYTCSTGVGTVVMSGPTSGAALSLPSTTTDEYYTVVVDAFSNGTKVGEVMEFGTGFYGWDVRFTVPHTF